MRINENLDFMNQRKVYLCYVDPKKLACKTGSGEIKRKLLIEENCFQLVTRKYILESPGNGNSLTILLAYSPSPPWH